MPFRMTGFTNAWLRVRGEIFPLPTPSSAEFSSDSIEAFHQVGVAAQQAGEALQRVAAISPLHAAYANAVPPPRAIDRPEACENCRNWHGQEYKGIALFCAMHPQGPEGDTCTDWEAMA